MEKYLENRTSHLGIIETLHIEAPGTYFFAYYTKTPRVFGSSFWNVTNINELEARILTIWLNSTINIAQLFIKRVPTGWFKVRGYTFDKLLLLSQKKLNKKEIATLNDVFHEVRKESFPSLWKQIARNVAPGTLTPEWKRMLSDIFLNFDKHLGRGFEPRRKIDNVILGILGYNEDDRKRILEWLYSALLKEVYILKKMNKVDVSG